MRLERSSLAALVTERCARKTKDIEEEKNTKDCPSRLLKYPISQPIPYTNNDSPALNFDTLTYKLVNNEHNLNLFTSTVFINIVIVLHSHFSISISSKS